MILASSSWPWIDFANSGMRPVDTSFQPRPMNLNGRLGL